MLYHEKMLTFHFVESNHFPLRLFINLLSPHLSYFLKGMEISISESGPEIFKYGPTYQIMPRVQTSLSLNIHTYIIPVAITDFCITKEFYKPTKIFIVKLKYIIILPSEKKHCINGVHC